MIFMENRPPLVLGNNRDHNFFELLPIRNRLGGEVGDAAVRDLDLILAFVEVSRFRFTALSHPCHRRLGFRQVQQVTHVLFDPNPTTLRRIAARSTAVAMVIWEREEAIDRPGEVVELLVLVFRG